MVMVVKRSDEGIYDSKKAQEVVDKRVSQLEEVVAKNKGEIVLLHRNIYGGSKDLGCWGGAISKYLSTFDVGVISGNLKKVDFKEAEMRAIIDIPSPDFFHGDGDYYYHAELLVPVERKFSARGGLYFDVDGLKKVEKGDIEFSRHELLPEIDILGYTRDSPFLVEFGVFVGESEIKNFVYADAGEILGHNFSGGAKERIEELFKLIRDPKASQRIIADDLFKKRNNLTGKLLGEVTSLANIDAQLFQIKPEVMEISFYYERDQDGSRDMYSSKGDLYSRYLGLRQRAYESLKGVENLLHEGDSLGLSKEDFKMSGTLIGFPSDIDSQRYFSFVSTELLPRVKNNLKEMDVHLRDAEKKAR